jgi:zinc protease
MQQKSLVIWKAPMRPVAMLLALLMLVAAGVPQARAAVKIQEVTSPGGITAWLVEDYSVPIVSMRFAFRGGTSQDPPGKEGLVNLMSGLFDEGAGELDSDAFQDRLDAAGAEMRFNAGRDAMFGSMRMLAEKKDEAFDLLRLAVSGPRFDQAPIDRIRGQIAAGIAARSNRPETAAQRAWLTALYQDHPYARRDEGTEETLAAITADDLRAMHRRMFARDNLIVGVVGAIDAETLRHKLDELFGSLPEKAALDPVPDVEPKLGQTINVPYDLPQATLQLAYPGIDRQDPRYFAAYLMNHILGGGTFTSRLFAEVRDKRGLAYGVSSAMVNHDHSAALVIYTATRADRAQQTLGVIQDVVAKLVRDGVTETELAEAKKYVIGAYAIANLGDSSSIANTLVGLQMEDLGRDYIDRREALINAVTLEEVQEAARTLLSPAPAVMVLGPTLPDGGKG